MVVGNGSAVEVNVVVVVDAFGEMVVIQGADDGQNQGKKGRRQEQHCSQRGRFWRPGELDGGGETAPRGAWVEEHD